MRQFPIITLLITCCLFSCKKDENKGEDSPSYEERIIGVWDIERFSTNMVNDSTGDTISSTVLPPNFFTLEIKEDKSFTTYGLGDTIQGSYSLNGSMITIMQVDTMHGNITQLTSNKLVIDGEVMFSDSSTTYTEYRHLECVK